MNAEAAAVAHMTAWPAPDPDNTRAANQPAHMPRVVSGLADDELQEHLNGELAQIARVARECGVKLERDGLPAEPVSVPQGASWQVNGANVINRSALRARAIQEEMARRVKRRQAQDEGQAAQARELLECVYAEGPAAVETLARLAQEVGSALGRLRQVARDLELIAGAQRVWSQHASLGAAIGHAASTLGRPVPKLAVLPEPVDRTEAQYLVRVLSDPELLRSLPLPSAPGNGNVLDAADQLREAASW